MAKLINYFLIIAQAILIATSIYFYFYYSLLDVSVYVAIAIFSVLHSTYNYFRCKSTIKFINYSLDSKHLDLTQTVDKLHSKESENIKLVASNVNLQKIITEKNSLCNNLRIEYDKYKADRTLEISNLKLSINSLEDDIKQLKLDNECLESENKKLKESPELTIVTLNETEPKFIKQEPKKSKPKTKKRKSDGSKRVENL